MKQAYICTFFGKFLAPKLTVTCFGKFLAPKLTATCNGYWVNLKKVPRRASQVVSTLNIAHLGLKDGAKLLISFKFFSKQTNPLLCKYLIYAIKNVCSKKKFERNP